MRRTFRIVPTVIGVALLAAACSGSGDGDAAATSANAGSTDTARDSDDGPGLVDEPDSTERPTGSSDEGVDDTIDEDADTDGPTESESASEPTVTTVLPTVPETGVPGLDSADLFCRSWSEFAGTFQALALASSFATEISAHRAEVVASGAIVAAVAGLGEHLPAELEGERVALTVDLVGPMERRAVRAYTSLQGGLSIEQLDELAEIWLTALAAAGVDEPDIQLDIPEDLALVVDGVAHASSQAVPLIRDDPSLVTDASTPLTDAYIVDNCPDQGTLGGNDVIEQ